MSISLYEVQGCCGVVEIAWVEEVPPKDVLLQVSCGREDPTEEYDSIEGSACGARWTVDLKADPYPANPLFQYIFTGVVKEGHTVKTYGPRLAAYIRRNRLGKVTTGPAHNNPNHKDHWIRTYIWAPNRAKLFSWFKRQTKGMVMKTNTYSYYNRRSF